MFFGGRSILMGGVAFSYLHAEPPGWPRAALDCEDITLYYCLAANSSEASPQEVEILPVLRSLRRPLVQDDPRELPVPCSVSLCAFGATQNC